MAKGYDKQDMCPVARTMAIIGDRWTMLVLRDLVTGTHRFGAFLESLQGISPNLLSDRLKRLEADGIVERVFYSQQPPRAEYHLTAKGKSLAPILGAMRDWGRAHTSARTPAV